MVLLFWLFFASTVVALGATAWAGIRGRRRAHFALAGLTLVCLFVTIRLTRSVVAAVQFQEDQLAFHLKFAISATVLLVPVLITGLLYARFGTRWLRLSHRAAVVLFVLAVLTATGTGVWAYSHAQ